MMLGCLNWLTIGMLQYDFIAGLFGSQANVFSRIIYSIIGIASLIVGFALIKGKGRLKLSTKFLNKLKSKNNQPEYNANSQPNSSPQPQTQNYEPQMQQNQTYENNNPQPTQNFNQPQTGFNQNNTSNNN